MHALWVLGLPHSRVSSLSHCRDGGLGGAGRTPAHDGLQGNPPPVSHVSRTLCGSSFLAQNQSPTSRG